MIILPLNKLGILGTKSRSLCNAISLLHAGNRMQYLLETRNANTSPSHKNPCRERRRKRIASWLLSLCKTLHHFQTQFVHSVRDFCRLTFRLLWVTHKIIMTTPKSHKAALKHRGDQNPSVFIHVSESRPLSGFQDTRMFEDFICVLHQGSLFSTVIMTIIMTCIKLDTRSPSSNCTCLTFVFDKEFVPLG